MTTRRALLPTLLWLLGTAGCEQGPAPLAEADQALATAVVADASKTWTPSVSIAAAATREDLATGEVIGLVPVGSRCPVPAAGSGWAGGELFAGAQVAPEPPLAGVFCAYAKTTPAAPPQNLPGRCNQTPAATCSSVSGPETWLEPVPRHLRALGLTGEARQDIATALRARFRALLAAPDPMPAIDTLRAPWNPLPAAVTVWALDNGGAHIQAVEKTVRDAACGDSPCGVIVQRANIFADESMPASALTFTREVFRITQQAAASGTRTLINASVGFPAELLNEPPVEGKKPQLYLAYEALKAAINHAGCKGVGFVAAIGNRTGGPNENSGAPMYPGGWSDGKAGWTCDGNPRSEPARPLMLAAGAVSGDGSDSPTTRPRAQAEYVAPGYAVARDVEGDTLYWEGSSFASAALAGVVAAAWSYMPHTTLQSAYGVVRKSALPLAERNTSLCFEGDSCTVKRIRLCHAVQMALGETARASGDSRVEKLANDMVCGGIERQPWTVADLDTAAKDALSSDLGTPTWEILPALPSDDICQAYAQTPVGQSRAPYSCPFALFSNGAERRAALETAPPGKRCPDCVVIVLNSDQVILTGGLVQNAHEVITAPALRLTIAPVVLDRADRLYELTDRFDANGRINVRLDAAVSQFTSVEAVLEYAINGGDGRELAQADPIPVVNLSASH